jgi:NAD(P)H dehydrogenase (quinone)
MGQIGAMHLIILGHPASTSLSDALAAAYEKGVKSAGAQVEVLTLRDLSFDPDLRAGFSGKQSLEPDLRSAQDAILRAHHVAWFFPTWWAGPPALVKAFIDRAFLPGYAFAYKKGQALPETLLKGRSARVVTTMDSPNYWYHLWHRSSVHASFVNATLKFVGFGPVKSNTLYRQKDLSAEQRAKFLAQMERLGEADGRAIWPRQPRLTGARVQTLPPLSTE